MFSMYSLEQQQHLVYKKKDAHMHLMQHVEPSSYKLLVVSINGHCW